MHQFTVNLANPSVSWIKLHGQFFLVISDVEITAIYVASLAADTSGTAG
jgi:hypothetical protein